jgi:hypothetical protein
VKKENNYTLAWWNNYRGWFDLLFFLLVLYAQLGQVSHSFKFKSYWCFHNWNWIRQYRFCKQTYCTLAYNCIGFIQLNVIFRFFDWIMWALWFSICIARKALALLLPLLQNILVCLFRCKMSIQLNKVIGFKGLLHMFNCCQRTHIITSLCWQNCSA